MSKPKHNPLKGMMGVIGDMSSSPDPETTTPEPEAAQPPAMTRAKSAPVHMMGFAAQRDDAMNRADEAEARERELARQLDEEKARAKPTGRPISKKLSELYKVPGRQRQLPPNDRQQMKENLRNNKLVHPLKILEDGAILSGNNRYDIFCELYEETGEERFNEIECVIDDSKDEDVEKAAFFANLFQTALSAFEQYTGLKHLQQANPHFKQADLCRITGLADGTVSELLSFDKLPASCHELIQRNKHAVGISSVPTLARLTTEGKGAQVEEAIKRLVEDPKFTNTDAIKLASASTKKPAPTKPSPITVRSGRATYCTITVFKKSMRLDFEDEDERIEMEKAVQEVLRQRAEKRKKGAETGSDSEPV